MSAENVGATPPGAHSYEAARVAARSRTRLIELRRPFIAETVLSHPSKLDLISEAKAAGYTVVLHALLIPENLAVARVAARVAAGGHDVPEDKIRGRRQRVWPLVARAIGVVDSAVLWDNSRTDGPRGIALFIAGLPVGNPAWPVWAPAALTGACPASTGH